MRVRWILLVLCGAVVLGAVWTAWTAWQVKRDLDDSVDAVHSLQAAAEAGDTDAMDAAIDRLTDASAGADSRTGGVTWSVLTDLPHYGDDARGVRVVSSVVHDLAIDGAQPLVAVSLNLDGVLPSDGQVSVDALASLQAPVADAVAALASADSALSTQDPTGFVAGLGNQYRDLETTVRDTHHALSSASTALRVLPTMLGSQQRRTYLLVFQNNAEIRATGGLPGAVVQIGVENGRIKLERQFAGNKLSRDRDPILPVSAAERALWDERLGSYFVNATLTPDFPRASSLMQAWWEDEFPAHVDGVLSIDPVALSYVLAVTGPIQVGDVTITTDDVVDELLHGVYVRYPDPDDQDAFFQHVARTAFEKILAGADDARGLLRALVRAADESRLLVHSFDPREQDALAGKEVSGELVAAPQHEPQVTVALNDSTGAKMSYYLRHDVRVEATSCDDGVQSYAGTARLRSVAPADAATLPAYITGGGAYGAPPGTQFVNVLLFAPAGGSVTDLRLNTQRIESAVIDYDGLPADTVAVQLQPGQRARLSWRMTSGPDQAGATRVSVTPGIEAHDYSSVAPSGCRD